MIELPTPREVQVWCLTGAEAIAEAAAKREILAEYELARAARYRTLPDRNLALASRVMLRVILSMYIGTSKQDLIFSRNGFGKPRLLWPPALHSLAFNLAHSDQMIVLACSRHRAIGIDVERIVHTRENRRVAMHWMSPAERLTLTQLHGAAWQAAYYAGWCRKEAYLKGLGTGLSKRLRNVEVEITPGKPARMLTPTGRWYLHDLDLGLDYAGAVATHGPATGVTVNNWPP